MSDTEVNPDSRELPPGYVTQYDPVFKAWFYVNIRQHPPKISWTHPIDEARPPQLPKATEAGYALPSSAPLTSSQSAVDANHLPTAGTPARDRQHPAFPQADTPHSHPSTPGSGYGVPLPRQPQQQQQQQQSQPQVQYNGQMLTLRQTPYGPPDLYDVAYQDSPYGQPPQRTGLLAGFASRFGSSSSGKRSSSSGGGGGFLSRLTGKSKGKRKGGSGEPAEKLGNLGAKFAGGDGSNHGQSHGAPNPEYPQHQQHGGGLDSKFPGPYGEYAAPDHGKKNGG